MSDEERVSPVEVVAGFIASEVGHWSPGMAEQARELIDALEAAGWQIVAGDAVVIPRDAIPDGLLRRVKHERHGSRALTVDDLVWVYAALNGRAEEAAARLLSGATTEGDER